MSNLNLHIGNKLPISLIYYIFDTYLTIDYKLLIHKEGSTDEDISKKLSIELIMISRLEDYFENVLLSIKFKENLCNISSEKGYLNTLKWSHNKKCHWDAYTCKLAAANGHLDCLKYAHENGCSMNGFSYINAIINKHEHCANYVRDNNCLNRFN